MNYLFYSLVIYCMYMCVHMHVYVHVCTNDLATFQAAVCIGRQPSPHSDMWVLGEDFQLNEHDEEMYASEVVWVKEVLNEFAGKRTETSAPKVVLPLSPSGLRDVLEATRDTLHVNVMAGFFTIGKCYSL